MALNHEVGGLFVDQKMHDAIRLVVPYSMLLLGEWLQLLVTIGGEVCRWVGLQCCALPVMFVDL